MCVAFVTGDMDIEKREWANSASPMIIQILYDIRGTGVALRPTGLLDAIERRTDESPSTMTVYRAVEQMEQEGIVEDAGSNRFILSEKGTELINEMIESGEPE